MIKFLVFLLIIAGVGYGAYWYFFNADQRLLDQASEAVTKGDYRSALNSLEELVKQHPRSDKVTKAEELKQEAGRKLRDELNTQLDKLLVQEQVDSAKALVQMVREQLGYLADNARYAGDMETKIAVANAADAFRQAEERAGAGDHAKARELLQGIKERHGQTEWGRRAADWLNDYKIRYTLTLSGVDAPAEAKFDPVIITKGTALPDFYVIVEANGARLFMTDVESDNAAPRWDKQQDVVLHDTDLLTFKLYDDDGLRGDELIATLEAPPDKLFSGRATVNSEQGAIVMLVKLNSGPAVR